MQKRGGERQGEREGRRRKWKEGGEKGKRGKREGKAGLAIPILVCFRCRCLSLCLFVYIYVSVCPVVDNTGSQSYRTCTGVGPNYIRTFDGLEYLFPGRCHYTVFSDGLRAISVKYINCHSYQQCRKVHHYDFIFTICTITACIGSYSLTISF